MMNNHREYRVKKTLTGQIRQKLGWQILLFVAITAALAGIIYLWLRRQIWYADDAWYGLLHKLNGNPWICVSLFLAWVAVGSGVICCRMIFRLIRYVDDITEGVNHIYRDTDEGLTMPQELLVVEQQLNEIRESTRRSRQLAKEAEQRKLDLIIYLAHDLKTPLTSVIGYLTMLSEEREISEQLRERYTGIALNKAERLEELINEFFDITRFNLSEIALEPSRVNVSRMLEQMAYEFRPVFEEKNLAYRLELPDNLELSIDVDKMSRVFDNLLKNAFYYSYPDSEIVICLGAYSDWESLPERVGQREDRKSFRENAGAFSRGKSPEEPGTAGGWCHYISFENRGKTIPEGKTEQIFEQFFRMESARSSRTGGAGLGLAIAREIVRKHGGELICESREEVIVFTVFLP